MTRQKQSKARIYAGRSALAYMAIALFSFALLADSPAASAQEVAVPQSVMILAGPEQPVALSQCVHSGPERCVFARSSDGFIGADLKPLNLQDAGWTRLLEPDVRGENSFTQGPDRQWGELVDLASGTYTALRRYGVSRPWDWLDPLRQVHVYYTGNVSDQAVSALRARSGEFNANPVPPGWVEPHQVLFVATPVRALPGLLDVPRRLTRTDSLTSGMVRIPKDANRELYGWSVGKPDFRLILESRASLYPDGSEAQPIVHFDRALAQGSAIEPVALDSLPVGPYRLRIEGLGGVSLDEAEFDIVLPDLSDRLVLSRDGETFDWTAAPSVRFRNDGLDDTSLGEMTLELVRLTENGEPLSLAQEPCVTREKNRCGRDITLGPANGELAPGRYAYQLLQNARQATIPHQRYLVAERRFSIEGRVPEARLGAGFLPEEAFAAKVSIAADAGDRFAPWQTVEITVETEPLDAFEGAGVSLILVPKARFTWQCQAAARQPLAILALTPLDEEIAALRFAGPEGIVPVEAATFLGRVEDAVAGRAAPLGPDAGQPLLLPDIELLPPPSLGSDAEKPSRPILPPIDFNQPQPPAPVRIPAEAPGMSGPAYDRAANRPAPTGRLGTGTGPRMATRDHVPSPAATPASYIRQDSRPQPSGAGPFKVSMTAPAQPGDYELVLLAGTMPQGPSPSGLAQGRVLARFSFSVDSRAARTSLDLSAVHHRLGFSPGFVATATSSGTNAEHPLTIEFWWQGDKAVGGAPARARRLMAAPLSPAGGIAGFPFGTSGDWKRLGLKSGAYEVRLTASGRILERRPVTIETLEPSLPWPLELAPGVVPDPPVGAAGSDPRQAILPANSLCEPPVFSSPPDLRLVRAAPQPLPELVDHPTEDRQLRAKAALDHLPVDTVYPGHPVIVEARFRPEDAVDQVYFVRLGDGRAVLVERSEEDPALYRSRTISFAGPAAPDGAGR